LPLERRIVPAFPGVAGIALDTSGDVFVSYDSTTAFSGQQQSVAEVGSNGFLVSSSVFGTTGASAFPGALTAVGPSASLPSISSSSAILELQPNGQLFVFDPVAGTSSQYDNLANDTVIASKVYDVQTGASVNLSGQISLSNATYGDFGIYQNSLVVSAESNNWDFVMRVTYGSSGNGAATVLAASPASDGHAASPGGVAVDTQGTVLATMPYVPAGSTTAIHVPVGFSINYDKGGGTASFLPTLGLTTVPNIDSGGIAVDSQNNFILAVSDSSLYGGGQGIVHINSALTAFLADATSNAAAIPSAIACQDVGGTSYLAFTDTASDTYTIATEIPLFSGQATPAQLRHAYGIDQIRFTGPGGATVPGDGSGQTIAIVEEGVDPTLGADLTTFDQFFGIAAPPSFQVVYQGGVTTQNPDIVGEASLDVEWAHAVAPGASIIVYDAAYYPNDPNTTTEDFLTAIQQASKLPGVSVVSVSYGITEDGFPLGGQSETSFDAGFSTPGVTFVASAGDAGAFGNGGSQLLVNYPAASPDVLAVGGTSIVLDAAGDYPGTGTSGEVAWGYGSKSGDVQNGYSGGGGGLSSVEPEPSWQSAIVPTSVDPTGTRAVPDVSIDSGATQPYDVFASTVGVSSTTSGRAAVGWLGDAGTSASAPIWAGLIAIADQGRALAGGTPLTGNTQTLPALYSLPAADFHDIVNGNNGYPAGPGFDLTSGRGTPIANLLVPDLASYGIPSQLTIKTEPPSTVAAGSTFGLTVQVKDRLGNAISGGTVTVALGNNPGDATLGGTPTAAVVNGVATFSDLTLSQPGTGYTLKVSDGAMAGSQTTTSIDVTAVTNPTKIVVTASSPAPVFGQSIVITATVSVLSPGAGVPTGTVTFKEGSTIIGTAMLIDRVAQLSTTPSPAGTETLTIAYSGDDQPMSVQFPLTVGQATPTLTWADPADINAGTPLGAAQLDASASFEGKPLPGVLTYTPAAGTMLLAGNSQSLIVSFSPTDSTDFKSVTSSVLINVLPQSIPTPGSTPTPTPAMVISEQRIFQRRVRKDGKPFGKAVLTGFTLDFNVSLPSAAATDPNNYQLDIIRPRAARKKLARILQPIKGFTVTYTPATDSVTLNLTSLQSFAGGGQITILPGVTGSSGSVLGGTTVFTITPGGKRVEPT
jgi:hypothetical protein